MNIFFLDRNPDIAAQMMHDKHVVKMILETAQILSTVHDLRGTWKEGMYRPTHQSHPCVTWCAEAGGNENWLICHGIALYREYTYRFLKKHKSEDVILHSFRHNITIADSKISIGCKSYKNYKEFLENYLKDGKQNGYSDYDLKYLKSLVKNSLTYLKNK